MPLADLFIASEEVARAGAEDVLLVGHHAVRKKSSDLEKLPIMSAIRFATNEGIRPKISKATKSPASPDRSDVKGFDLISLGNLYELLIGDASEQLSEFSLVYEKSNDGPWIYAVPSTLLERLSILTTSEIKKTAVKWARTDELGDIEERLPGTVKEVLTEIVQLARRAKAVQKQMFLWQSL